MSKEIAGLRGNSPAALMKQKILLLIEVIHIRPKNPGFETLPKKKPGFFLNADILIKDIRNNPKNPGFIKR